MDNAPPTTHRISEFHKWSKEKCLQLRPPFQRKPVWSEKNKSYLIDTILNGYPVPEVYVQVKTDKDGNTKYVVVDGQQRINSILEFIEGEYELLDSESDSFGGRDFKDLPDGIKKDFWDFSIVTRELKTDSDDEVRNVFRRLNRYVVPLNQQELRNATFRGEFIKLMNELSEDDFFVENKIVTATDVRRMRDIEFISELFLGMLEGIQDGTKSLNKFYKLYDVDFTNKQDWKKKFFRIQNQIIDILGELTNTKWKSKSDFYSLFVSFNDYVDRYYFPQENYENLANSLNSFRDKVNIDQDTSKEKNIVDYFNSLQGGVAKKDNRAIRVNILKNLILPYLTPKDDKRNFNDEQRQLAWDLSKDKKCAICGKKVEWTEYNLDHIQPHSKGGKTELKNSQIAHKSCNISKSNK